MSKATAASDVLGRLCQDLALLRRQAGGPSVRALAARVGMGKSQVAAIFAGTIRQPPDWQVLRGLIEAVYEHARDNRLSIRSGLDEYWRPRYAVVEHAFSEPAQPRPEKGVVPRQLPPATPHFTGRRAEMAAMTRAAGGGALLVTGMAGVGKTALAVAWSRRAARRFPDGQLFVDLRGFDPSGKAVSAAEAVRGFLEALGVSPHMFPVGLDAQVALYRSLMAGRRMLVVLDNARDSDQVRPLLPGAADSLTVVTSRVELTGLIAAEGAFPLVLNAFDDGDARRMLSRRLGARRVEAEPEAAGRLIARCGHLPMALAIVAARTATRPGFSLAAIAEETDGLGAPQTGEPTVDVRAVFSWSYDALSAPAARLFRLLAIHPGPDIGARAAASMAALSTSDISPLLAELSRHHLITEPRPGRFGFHDLLRTYALELAGEDEAARNRMLCHYAHTSYAAALLFSPRRSPIALPMASPGVTPEPLNDANAAIRWFEDEWRVLHALAERRQIWSLGWAAADFLEMRGYFHEWSIMADHSVAVARRLAEPMLLARLLLISGNACWRLNCYGQALEVLEEARDVFRDLAEPGWQAQVEHAMGGLMDAQDRIAEALGHAQRSLDLAGEAGDTAAQARAYNAMGWSYGRLGDHRRALDHCRLALSLHQKNGHRYGEATAWNGLARAHRGLREHEAAISCHETASGIMRELGMLTRAGETHEATGTLNTA